MFQINKAMALKEKLENKVFKEVIQDKSWVSPNSEECPFVILQPFMSGGVSFGSHLTVDIDLLQKAIDGEGLIEKGFVRLKDE